MMKNCLKKMRGITLVTLSITVIIILIITSTIIYNMTANLGIGKLRDMQNDIKNLRSKVADYYSQYGDIPARKDVEYTNIANIEKAGVISSAVDTGKFYVIELSSLDNLTLTYGKDYEQVKAGSDPNSLTDLYIINEASHNIFYVAGIPLDGEWFYTDYTSDQIDTEEIPRRVVDGVAIPENFYYAGGTKEEGLVISDVEGDDLENSKGGNQFVWIPVENYEDFVRQNGYRNNAIQTDYTIYNTGEADSLGINENLQKYNINETNTTKEEAKAMYRSVKVNKGFFIGRYETGYDDGEPVIKKGYKVYQAPWTETGEILEEDGTGYGAIEESRMFVQNNAYRNVTSTLCYGVQWDAVMNFIDPNYITNAEVGTPNCSTNSYVRNSLKGWYSSDETERDWFTETGYQEEKHIYDLSGNVYEWTMESYGSDTRVIRGGDWRNYGTENPASDREEMYPNTGDGVGFRICLFINPPEEEKVELPEGLKVGSTVYYNPDGTYLWQSKYCGSPEDTTYQKTLDSSNGAFDLQRWRVFDYNEETGEVMLVPEHSTDDGGDGADVTSGTVYLRGAQGYNNAVQLLNEACSNLYGNKEKKITARSIKIEDIEGKMDGTKLATLQENAGYSEQVSNAYTKSNSWYPSIYAKEKLACINGSKNNSGVGISEQYENRLIEPDESLINTTKITEGKVQGENLQPTHTYYLAKYSDLETAFIEKDGVNYKDLLLSDEDNTYYWVASRCVYAYLGDCGFGGRDVSGGDLDYYDMVYSDGSVGNGYFGLFPVVSLPGDLLEEGTDTDFIVK